MTLLPFWPAYGIPETLTDKLIEKFPKLIQDSLYKDG